MKGPRNALQFTCMSPEVLPLVLKHCSSSFGSYWNNGCKYVECPYRLHSSFDKGISGEKGFQGFQTSVCTDLESTLEASSSPEGLRVDGHVGLGDFQNT